MDFALDDTQREIQDGARRLVEEIASLDQVVAAVDSEQGYDAEAWRQIAELGWTGMQIPEEHGGAGLGHVELAVVLEQLGGALHPSPFFATVCMAGNLLVAAAEAGELGDPHAGLLAQIAAGEKTATLVHAQPGRHEDTSFTVEAQADGDGFVLSGTATYVVDGTTADVLIVAAHHEDGVVLASVSGDATGVTRTPVHSVDATRRLGSVSFDGVRVAAADVLATRDAADAILETALQLAAVALAAESLGAAQHCFDTTLAYTKDRHQFGRPIAAFQAVKHICADLLMRVEGSRSAVYYAAWAASAQREELPVVAPLAKAHASETLWETARMSIQLHGGIGFTFEHEAHRYYRRATASRVLLGDTSSNRELLLRGIGV